MANIYVKQDGTADYTTVLDAIQNASSSDNIIIQDTNTYTETWNDVTIPSSINIEHEGSGLPYCKLRINWNANTINTMNDVTFHKIIMDWQDITTNAVIQYNAGIVTFDRCFLYNVTEVVNADCQSGTDKLFYNCILSCDSVFNAASNFDSNSLLFRNCSIRYSTAFVTGDFYASHDADEPYFENCIITKSGNNITKSNFAPSMQNTNYNVLIPRFEYCVFTGDPQTVNATLGIGCVVDKTESEIYVNTNFTNDEDWRINDLSYIVNSGDTSLTEDYAGISRSDGNDIGAFEYEQVGTAPDLTSVDPFRADRGETVTVTGTDLTSDGMLSVFGDPVSFTFVSSTEITFVVPSTGGQEGYPNPIEFSNEFGSDTIAFHLIAKPVITGKSADAVFIGDSINIFGENFLIFPYVEFYEITFDGVSQTVSDVGESDPDVIIIDSASGVDKNQYVDVTVVTEDGSDTKTDFIRIKALPRIDNLNKYEFYKDEILKIIGEYFTNNTETYPTTIYIDYGELENDYYESLTDTEIQLSFPANITEGNNYTIQVYNRDGQAINEPSFYLKVLPKFLSYPKTLAYVGEIYNYGINVEGEYPEEITVVANDIPDFLELVKISTYVYELRGEITQVGSYNISLTVFNSEKSSTKVYTLRVIEPSDSIEVQNGDRENKDNIVGLYIE